MIDLNSYRANLYTNAGLRPCPGYGEDGILRKIFTEIGTSKMPLCIEFGELRVLGSTTRVFRIDFLAKAIYFSDSLDMKSRILNIADVLKITITRRNLKYLKFLLTLPRRMRLEPGNVIQDLGVSKKDIIDLFVVDIDSFDYEIVKEVLENEITPRVFIVEYNPNFPYRREIYVTFEQFNKNISNRRIYGTSYASWISLFDSYGYNLVHISGFCNLIFIHQSVKSSFTKPNIAFEITDTDEKVLDFARQHCITGFVPSWLVFPRLDQSDLEPYVV